MVRSQPAQERTERIAIEHAGVTIAAFGGLDDTAKGELIGEVGEAGHDVDATTDDGSGTG